MLINKFPAFRTTFSYRDCLIYMYAIIKQAVLIMLLTAAIAIVVITVVNAILSPQTPKGSFNTSP